MSAIRKSSPDADYTVYFSFCESVAQTDEHILITSLINGLKNIAHYVKPGTQVPNDSVAANKRIQAAIVASTVKENESYLGKVSFVLVRQEMADVILFPRSPEGIFCVVARRPYDLDKMTTSILEALQALQPTAVDDKDDGNNKSKEENKLW
jgi:hypothetical protein